MSYPDLFSVKVAGVTFAPNYPSNLYECQEAFAQQVPPLPKCGCGDPTRCRECRGTGLAGGGKPLFAGFGEGDHEPLAAVLIRNPNNEHDSNAIEVHIPSVDAMIGHVDRHTAADIAPLIDAGEKFRAGVSSINVMPGHEDRPGIVICIQKVEQHV